MKYSISFSGMVMLLLILLSGCATPLDQPVTDPITVNTLRADYSWIGWGSRGYTMNVKCTDGTCNASATCLNATGEETQEVNLDSILLDENALQDIGTSLGSLRRVDAAQEVIEHTDDYPHYTITLTADNGQEIMVTSTSNTDNNAPWNIQIDDRLYVQEGTAFPDAYFALLNKVGPNACW